MNRNYFVMLLTLAALLSFPGTGFAVDSNRSDGKSGDSAEARRSDRRNGTDSARRDRRGAPSRRTHGAIRGRRSYSAPRVISISGRGARSYDGHRTIRYGTSGTRTRVVVRQPTVVVTERIYPRRYIEPMYLSVDRFERVLWDLDRARFEEDRVAIIHRVARLYTVTTHQARAMVSRLRFGENRLGALVDLHPRVRDRDRWYRVYDLLTSGEDRRRLRRRCGL